MVVRKGLPWLGIAGTRRKSTEMVVSGACSTWMRRVVHRHTSLMMTAAATGYTPHRGCHRVGYGLTVVTYVCWPFAIFMMTAALTGFRFASNL